MMHHTPLDNELTVELLMRLNQPVPRYTSYPTAPEWGSLSAPTYTDKLELIGQDEKPISLYVHIPFCQTMCLYCGCSVILNRKPENEERYVDYLLKEIELISRHLGAKRTVKQLHFGGGTPTQLSVIQLERLFRGLDRAFSLDWRGEIAIEIDPRTVAADYAEKLRFIRRLGFNRVSFGVQDTNEQVQEAVKRRQSYEMTRSTFYAAQELGFKGINIDLIYGLPLQTKESFQDTVEKICTLSPDRIALFSYAKVPWLKPHQKAISDKDLPTTEEKFVIYLQARKAFKESGYIAIGMDHFAKKEDELAQAYLHRTLDRNFQGYTVRSTEDMIGLGITAIGYVGNTYAQNVKELSEYYHLLDQSILPVKKGKELSEEDLLRKWVIHKLMCDFSLDKQQFFKIWDREFNTSFSNELKRLTSFIGDQLIVDTPEQLVVTDKGQLFIRNIASQFDAYLHNKKGSLKFSMAV